MKPCLNGRGREIKVILYCKEFEDNVFKKSLIRGGGGDEDDTGVGAATLVLT